VAAVVAEEVKHAPVWLVSGLLVVAIVFAALAVPGTGCGSSHQLPSTSMKGFELYSWQEDGDWHFSLLVGTNRTKTVEEIHASGTRLDGLDALTPALRGIAAGQWVTWWTPSWAQGSVSFPPASVVEQVRGICKEQGLELQVVTQGP
jgi:hypothetical protein